MCHGYYLIGLQKVPHEIWKKTNICSTTDRQYSRQGVWTFISMISCSPPTIVESLENNGDHFQISSSPSQNNMIIRGNNESTLDPWFQHWTDHSPSSIYAWVEERKTTFQQQFPPPTYPGNLWIQRATDGKLKRQGTYLEETKANIPQEKKVKQ